MTPRHRTWRALCLLASVVGLSLVAGSRAVSAQGAGAAFLLLPVGARAVGAGEAAIADTLGVEGAWWNPASMAGMLRSELSLSGSQTFEGNSAAIAFARPSKALGTIAVTANILDYGDQGVTDPNSGQDLGTLSVRSSIAMVSYATSVGDRFRVGLNYKYARLAFTCSGLCGETPQFVGSSTALDLGAQYRLPIESPVTVAAALRHVGPDFQVRDAEQADPLPRTWQVGASGRIPSAALDSAGVQVDLLADLLGSLAYDRVSVRLGTAVTYRARYALRAGYTVVEGERGGPSIGLGVFLNDGMVLDIARRFDSFSVQAGQAPTYVSLRFLF